MDGVVDVHRLHGVFRQALQAVDARRQQILQEGADEAECEIEHQRHDGDEHGQRRPFARQDLVDLLAAQMLAAFLGLGDAALAHLLDVGEAHVRHGSAAVQIPLAFHLQHDVLQHFLLVLVQGQLIQDQLIALDDLAGGKAQGQPGLFRVVLNQMHHSVDAAVHRAAVVRAVAKILPQGLFLIFGDVQGVLHQFVHALIAGGGNGHHGHAQHGLHGVDVHRAAVAVHFVHHVQGHHRGDAHLQHLHGQVQVALDVGGVHDVDDGLGVLVQHKIATHQLLAGIGGHGVNARQVGDQGVGMAADDAVLAVHGDAGKIAHVLIGAGELVEQRGFAAVLVAHQGEGQLGSVRQGIAAALGMEFALLAQARMGGGPALGRGRGLPDRMGNRQNRDLIRVRQAQGQFIPVDAQLDGVAQGSRLDHGHLHPGDDTHIQKMLPQRAFAAHGLHLARLSRLQILDGHTNHLPVSFIKRPDYISFG